MQSRFPEISETIFTTISKLASEHQAINLGQGFPDYDGSPYLKERLHYYSTHDYNQYAPMIGVEPLREALQKFHGHFTKLDKDTDITITSGATEALFSCLTAFVGAGDEVIVFDPAFDCYKPQILFNQGIARSINLKAPEFKIDWSEVAATVNEKTKAIILNFPHNPCGSILTQDDLDELHKIVKERDLVILSDEVYQFMVFDNAPYVSPFYDERLKAKTIKIASFGKMFHMTGWKTGYCLASSELSKEIRKVHQYNTFCSFGPAQYALADMLSENPDHPLSLAKFYQDKRDYLLAGLKHTKFKLIPTKGSYFQLVDYSELAQTKDIEFCQKLITDKKLATIPISGFYSSPPKSETLLRLSFAKSRPVLDQALAIMKNL